MTGRTLLRPLAWLYAEGAERDRRRKIAERYDSPLPVISVGNLSVGGTGKTPLTIHLLREIQKRSPVLVLSRGYGRSEKRDLLWKRGDPQPDYLTFGDEPTLIASHVTNGGVAVGADRAALLRRLEPEFPGAVVLLDDGFQHHRLARDLDIVIVDDRTAELPLPMPAGVLRERPEALARAQIILTTSDAADEFARRYGDPAAERIGIGFESTEPVGWKTARRYDRDEPALLVTGIANPERVLKALRAMDIQPRSQMVFRDHQAYMPREISDIRQELRLAGATRIITTAKDAVKLQWHADLAPLLWVVGVNVIISQPERLMKRVWETVATNMRAIRA